jgi:hypothetical protein
VRTEEEIRLELDQLEAGVAAFEAQAAADRAAREQAKAALLAPPAPAVPPGPRQLTRSEWDRLARESSRGAAQQDAYREAHTKIKTKEWVLVNDPAAPAGPAYVSPTASPPQTMTVEQFNAIARRGGEEYRRVFDGVKNRTIKLID